MAHVIPLGGLRLDGWRAKRRLERAKLAALLALAARRDLDPDGKVLQLYQQRLAIARRRRGAAR